jgi:hypothetical protein
MAKRVLTLAVTFLVAGACQVDPIAIVDCRTTADCFAGEVCSPTHACVDASASSMAGAGGNAGAPEDGTAGALPSGLDGQVGPGTPLAWGADARLEASNPFGMRGGWFYADDCVAVATAIADGSFVCPAEPPTPSCCTAWDPMLVGPAPERSPGLAISGGTVADGQSRVCLKGTVSQVLNDTLGAPAFSAQWGAILSLQLNEGVPFDATRTWAGGKIIGFMFELDGPPMTQPIRVGYHTTTNDTYFVEVTVPTRWAQVLFSDVKLGDWVMPQVPFDATQLSDIAFDVPADATTSTPFDFCIANLRVLLTNDLPGRGSSDG